MHPSLPTVVLRLDACVLGVMTFWAVMECFYILRRSPDRIWDIVEAILVVLALEHALWPMRRVLGIRAYSMSIELVLESRNVL